MTVSETDLIDGLKAGVRRTRKFMAQVTDFHGGPAETEYLITTDIARAFLDRQQEVCVEALNRDFCHALASNAVREARVSLGLQRTDVALGDHLMPSALIEVKIRVRSLGGIVGDLNKMISTMVWMKPSRHRSILAASVFQVYAPATKKRWEREHFEKAVARTERKLEAELKVFAVGRPDFEFRLHRLHDPADGIEDFSLEETEDGLLSYGQPGHAVSYYAVIIKHRLHGTSGPTSLADLKAEASLKPMVAG